MLRSFFSTYLLALFVPLFALDDTYTLRTFLIVDRRALAPLQAI